MPGQIFSGTECKSIDQSVKASELLNADDICPSCGNGPTCTYNGQLGIRYGHCYTMKDTSDMEITRDNTLYYLQAYKTVEGHRGLVFRICHSTTNCTEKLNEFVSEGDFWFQRDEKGVYEGSGPNFVNLVGGYLYAAASPPANFTGKGTCIFGQCAICVQLASPPYGLSRIAGYKIVSTTNPSNCIQWQYEETSCIPAVHGAGL